MSLVLIGTFAIKAFFVVMFALNVAVLLTWADRRQGAVMQDRVGPNRAVIWLPTRLAQVMLALPAFLVAGGVLALVAGTDVKGPILTTRAIVFSHLSILMSWLTALVIAARIRSRGSRSKLDAQ